MIRLLDRYVLTIFLSALAVFTSAFVVLFVTVDFAMQLKKFLDLRSVPLLIFIGEYYLLRLPMILTYLLPMVVLFAAMFTVFKLSQANEILPIAASGTSLRRMALPFLLMACMTSGFMASMDEFLLVRVQERIDHSERILESRELDWGAYNWDGRTKIWAGKFDHVRLEMSEGVRVSVGNEEMRHIRIVTGKRASWDPDREKWIVFEGEIEKPNEPRKVEGGRPIIPRTPIEPEGYVVEADFPPETFVKGGRRTLYGQLTSPPLAELLAEARQKPDEPKYMMKVHSRLAFPISPLILLLLGLPSIMAAQAQSFFKGLFFCFLLSMAYYLTFFAFIELGNRGLIPALLAGWGPTAAFGAVGVTGFTRMRT